MVFTVKEMKLRPRVHGFSCQPLLTGKPSPACLRWSIFGHPGSGSVAMPRWLSN
jgi:hypothetical protein